MFCRLRIPYFCSFQRSMFYWLKIFAPVPLRGLCIHSKRWKFLAPVLFRDLCSASKDGRFLDLVPFKTMCSVCSKDLVFLAPVPFRDHHSAHSWWRGSTSWCGSCVCVGSKTLSVASSFSHGLLLNCFSQTCTSTDGNAWSCAAVCVCLIVSMSVSLCA